MGDTEYATLQEAINNANGGTVTLLADVNESVTIAESAFVTLELGGFTLTNAANQHTITNNGVLTIQGAGTVDNISHVKGALVNYGTATLNGGNITRSQDKGTSAGANGNSWYTIFNQGSLSINAPTAVSQNGGSFSSLIENGWPNGYAGGTATLNITGGTFTDGINAVKNDEGGDLTITGGTFKGDNTAVMNWNVAVINGGEFSSTNGYALSNGSYLPDNGSIGQLTVNGGTFTSGNGGTNPLFGEGVGHGDNGSIVLNGGQFTGTVDNALDGSSLVILPDATVTDSSGNPATLPEGTKAVAQVDGAYYTSLDAALAAAATAADKTVTLLGTIEVDKPVEITVEGVTVTGGELKPSAGFAPNGDNGSIVTVKANNVTLSGVTVDAGNNANAKYAVQFYVVSGGNIVNSTIIANQSYAAVLLNGSQASVESTGFVLPAGCYAAIELSKGSGVTAEPEITLGKDLSLKGSDGANLGMDKLVCVDLAPTGDEKLTADLVKFAEGASLNGSSIMLSDNGELVVKPTPTPDPQPETPAATPAPAPVLDSTPKTGAVAAFALLPLAGLGLAALGVAAKRKEQ